jgi:Zn finger protein HypA/HybF involved in hydrogenase expression
MTEKRATFRADQLQLATEPGWMKCPRCMRELWQTENLGRAPECCGGFMICLHGKEPPS